MSAPAVRLLGIPAWKLRNLIWTACRPIYAFHWLRLKIRSRFVFEPWLSQRATAFLDSHLTRDMRGLEWGSGRSTVWFARRVQHLTSIESCAGWHAIVLSWLKRDGLVNIDCLLAPPAEQDWYPFVHAADHLLANSLDFALIDGGPRYPCVPIAVRKLRPGGLLVIDNTDWAARLEEWYVPPDWPIVHQSSNGCTQTTIWRKP